jgi:FtsH-binding integral membrane protein
MGKIDRWGSKNEILIMPIMSTLLYIFITVMSFFPQTWNLPVKVTDENKETVYTSAKSLIIFTKVEVLSIFLYITYYTATTQPLPIAFLPVSMIILFSTIIFFTVRIYRTGTRKKQTSQ